MKNISNFVDNRDIRDRKYLGPLVNFYNETNLRHRNIVGKISKEQALKTIYSILNHDLTSLKGKIERQNRYLNEKEKSIPELTFKEFYDDHFYYLLNNFIKSGFNFKLSGYYEFLNKETVKSIQIIQKEEIFGRLSLFNPRIHVSISEIEFKPIYEKHKEELNWFWDKDPILKSKYKSIDDLKEAYINCKNRILECEELLKNNIDG